MVRPHKGTHRRNKKSSTGDRIWYAVVLAFLVAIAFYVAYTLA